VSHFCFDSFPGNGAKGATASEQGDGYEQGFVSFHGLPPEIFNICDETSAGNGCFPHYSDYDVAGAKSVAKITTDCISMELRGLSGLDGEFLPYLTSLNAGRIVLALQHNILCLSRP
jgi:hypothetical protein